MQMDQPFITDEKPRELGPASDIQEIGLSFPMFELTEQGARDGIAQGSVDVIRTENRWVLVGDGAQPTVSVERLSAQEDVELRVRVQTGGLHPDRGVWEAEYLRQKNGWLKLDGPQPPGGQEF